MTSLLLYALFPRVKRKELTSFTIDIIFQGTYERDYDEKRYGDIWRKKSFPNVTTPGY